MVDILGSELCLENFFNSEGKDVQSGCIDSLPSFNGEFSIGESIVACGFSLLIGSSIFLEGEDAVFRNSETSREKYQKT